MPEDSAAPVADPKAVAPAAAPTPSSPDPGASPAPQAPWGDNWREAIVGEDKGRLKTYERFQSPKDLANAYDAMREKMSAGQIREAFPADGSDEDKAAWRKSNGIPETPEAYLEKLPDGLAIDENDKENVAGFAKAMHAKNAPPELVHEALSYHYRMVGQAQAQRIERDGADKTSTQEALIADMGLADYRRGVNGIVSWAESLPDGAGEAILNARGPDGTALLNNPSVARALMQVVRELNPVHMVVPAGGGDPAKSIADELAGLRKMMGNQNSDYWKGPKASQLQARYRELIDAKDRMSGQAA